MNNFDINQLNTLLEFINFINNATKVSHYERIYNITLFLCCFYNP